MISWIDISKITDDAEIFNLLNDLKEGLNIEFKASELKLPKDIWETISSFSNTNGGIIFLGVVEGTNENEIVGVKNPDKQIKDLVTNLRNEEKISIHKITSNNIRKIFNGDKCIIEVVIPEAPIDEKPTYLCNNPLNAYLRINDSDVKITKNELKSLITASDTAWDNEICKGATLSDLDEKSINLFMTRLDKRDANNDYQKISQEEFLLNLALCKKSENGDIEVKNGCLLFLGKISSIWHFYPHFHLDYFLKDNSAHRWIDRVSDDNINDVNMNLLNFFDSVDKKISINIPDKFMLSEEGERVDSSGLKIALREALVNCIAHANYNQEISNIKISQYENMIEFSNPGQMLVSIKDFACGGESKPRNELIMKCFRFLGFSERQGEGGKTIYKNASALNLRMPALETSNKKTLIKIWFSDYADSLTNYNEDERHIVKILSNTLVGCSISDITSMTNLSYYKCAKYIKRMEKDGTIVKKGAGPATKYTIPSIEKNIVGVLEKLADAIRRINM